MARPRPPILDAFNARYVMQPSGCWEWIGSRDKGGYGEYQTEKIPLGDGRYNRRRKKAQRIAWELFRGPIPPRMEVCHECDNPPCVNPAHLFLATHKQNMEDRDWKGRHAYGVKHYQTKLTEQDVRDIRASRLTLAELAPLYGIAPQTISEIKNRKTWKHVAGERLDNAGDNQFRRGSAHALALLTEADIPTIRRRLQEGQTCVAIGRDYGVSDAVIRHIKKGRTWTHVP